MYTHFKEVLFFPAWVSIGLNWVTPIFLEEREVEEIMEHARNKRRQQNTSIPSVAEGRGNDFLPVGGQYRTIDQV